MASVVVALVRLSGERLEVVAEDVSGLRRACAASFGVPSEAVRFLDGAVEVDDTQPLPLAELTVVLDLSLARQKIERRFDHQCRCSDALVEEDFWQRRFDHKCRCTDVVVEGDFWHHREFLRSLLDLESMNGIRLMRHAPAEVRQNKNLVVEIVGRSGWALRHAADDLKEDPDVVLAAVKSNASAFLFALGAARVSSKIIRIVLRARENLFHAESYDLAQKLGWWRPRPPPPKRTLG
jgi:hypothetical protein